MLNSHIKQGYTLELFRLKAHLRSYVKDSIQLNEQLLARGAERLRAMPFKTNDPAADLVIDLVHKAYNCKQIKANDLTDAGKQLVGYKKHKKRTLKSKKHHGNEINGYRYLST